MGIYNLAKALQGVSSYQATMNNKQASLWINRTHIKSRKESFASTSSRNQKRSILALFTQTGNII